MRGMDMSSGNYSFISRILFFVWIVYWILRFLGYVFSLPLLSHPTLEAAMVGREDGFVDEHCIHTCLCWGRSGSCVLWREEGHIVFST